VPGSFGYLADQTSRHTAVSLSAQAQASVRELMVR
jgi:hypothetical protein